MAHRVGSSGVLVELEQDAHLAKLVSNWDFSVGKRFEADVCRKFVSSVHHPSSSPERSFFMLAVFRRYLFRLTEESVSMALHCCLGGTPAGFHVTYLQDRHFRFSVASKDVGLFVRALKRVTTDHFDVYFHLWRDGGDDWIKEKKKWELEEKASWSPVTGKRNKKSSSKKVVFHEKIVQDSPLFKSKPKELQSVVKIGSMFCPIVDTFPSIIGSSKPSEDDRTASPVISSCLKRHSAFSPEVMPCAHQVNRNISANRIFQNLKRVLIDTKAGSITSRALPAHPIGRGSDPSTTPYSRICFRCLGDGHFIRDCKNNLRCYYCYNYGHRAKFCAKRRFDFRHKWVPTPNKPHLVSKCLDSREKVAGASNDVIEWSLGPNAPSDTSSSNQGAITHCIPSHHDRSSSPIPPDNLDAQLIFGASKADQAEEVQDQVSSIGLAAINSASVREKKINSASFTPHHSHIGPGQSFELSPELNNMLVDQERAQQKSFQVAYNLPIVPINLGPTSEQIDREHREAINNFLISGLRQMMTNRLNIQGSRLLGSLAISNSIIHIDLAALGISSLSITLPIPCQRDTPEPRDACNIVPVLEVQRHQAGLMASRNTQITKVYHRRKFRRNKSSQTNMRNSQMQEERSPIFPELVEDYMVIQDQSKVKDGNAKKPLSRKRKCSTPVSASKLRRSDRLSKIFDGHKPKHALPSKSLMTRSQRKGKKVALQSSITSTLLIPPSSSDVQFPDLSVIDKHNETGSTYPEIPITEIQKLATQKCRIAPSEVTAELLLASRKEVDNNGGRGSLEGLQMTFNG